MPNITEITGEKVQNNDKHFFSFPYQRHHLQFNIRYEFAWENAQIYGGHRKMATGPISVLILLFLAFKHLHIIQEKSDFEAKESFEHLSIFSLNRNRCVSIYILT